MTRNYERGEIYYADFSAVIGSEQSGYRPVVILQNNEGNRHSPTVIVAAITSKEKSKQPTHVFLENTLPVPSVILLEQLRTIDKTRLGDYIGKLNRKSMRQVNSRLRISLGLPT